MVGYFSKSTGGKKKHAEQILRWRNEMPTSTHTAVMLWVVMLPGGPEKKLLMKGLQFQLPSHKNKTQNRVKQYLPWAKKKKVTDLESSAQVTEEK